MLNKKIQSMTLRLKEILLDMICENVQIYECGNDYACQYAIIATGRSNTHIASVIDKLHLKIKHSSNTAKNSKKIVNNESHPDSFLLSIDDSNPHQVNKITKKKITEKNLSFDFEFGKKIIRNKSNEWGILDCTDFMVHVLTEEKRNSLDLDRFFKEEIHSV